VTTKSKFGKEEEGSRKVTESEVIEIVTTERKVWLGWKMLAASSANAPPPSHVLLQTSNSVGRTTRLSTAQMRVADLSDSRTGKELEGAWSPPLILHLAI